MVDYAAFCSTCGGTREVRTGQYVGGFRAPNQIGGGVRELKRPCPDCSHLVRRPECRHFWEESERGTACVLCGELVQREIKIMKQKLEEKHELDSEGNPAGGTTLGTGILIKWQNGPLGRGEDRKDPNGAFVEGVIQAAIGRLEFYQTTSNRKFACRENAIALTHLETALLWLEKRTHDREEREVEGTHTP